MAKGWFDLPPELRNLITSYILPTPDDPKLFFFAGADRVKAIKKCSQEFSAASSRKVFYGFHVASKQTRRELPSLEFLLAQGAIIPVLNPLYTRYRELKGHEWGFTVLEYASRIRLTTHLTIDEGCERFFRPSIVYGGPVLDEDNNYVIPFDAFMAKGIGIWSVVKYFALKAQGLPKDKVLQLQMRPGRDEDAPITHIFDEDCGIGDGIYNLSNIEVLNSDGTLDFGEKAKAVNDRLQNFKTIHSTCQSE